MMTVRLRCSLALVLAVLNACGGEAQPQPAVPEPEPMSSSAGAAPPVEAAPVAAASAPAPVTPPAPQPVSKLKLAVFTGSPEGFLVTSTLVSGEKEAVLIDAAFTLADGKKVAESVKASGKMLTTVYVTHWHPDHYFGAGPVKEAFPQAKLVALPSTVAEIKKTWAEKVKQWKPMYKDAITAKPLIPEALAGNVIELEGEKLEITGEVQGDDAHNSYVWIPTLRAVITGDIVYDGVYPWTAETNPEQRKAWSAMLDRISALKPLVVAPGHQKPDRKQDESGIQFTKAYLKAFDEALATSKEPAELQAKLKAQFPDAALDVILKLGAEAALKKPKK
jgi:glyoxylase-like metal-dependent hydrolase (beta-lactamase superfamily II)